MTTAGGLPAGITFAPDGNLWFTEKAGNKIGTITLKRRHSRVRRSSPQQPESVDISSIGPSVTTTINAIATPTFAIFATATGAVPFSPAANRIFVEFSGGGIVRGSTSVAVKTQ